MKNYMTKTGISLEVIQGEGLGDGIARGQLKLVSQNEPVRPDSSDAICIEMRQLWSKITDCLTLTQYAKTMGGSMRYASKAVRATKVSRNKTVHALAARIIELDNQLTQNEKGA